ILATHQQPFILFTFSATLTISVNYLLGSIEQTDLVVARSDFAPEQAGHMFAQDVCGGVAAVGYAKHRQIGFGISNSDHGLLRLASKSGPTSPRLCRGFQSIQPAPYSAPPPTTTYASQSSSPPETLRAVLIPTEQL